jgi:two-component system cell cycle response regulator DivK
VTAILLIEDNELNRDMLRRRLERRGYSVLVAADGASGLAAARAKRPDLILMDIRLPDLDGRDLAKALKADASTRHIPVIALTAHAMEGDRAAALQAGCDDYDTKPVDLPRLIGLIEALVRRTSARE